MELWIRSQDRKFLAKCECIGIYKKNGVYEFAYGFTTYGCYETEERALEVLDEIQAEILLQDKPVQALKDEYNITDNIVYEMPKE